MRKPESIMKKHSMVRRAGFITWRHRRAIVLLAYTAGVFFGGSAYADMNSEAAEVDALFEAFTAGVQPGVAVSVTQDGDTLFEGTYGYADLDKRAPVERNTAFRLASVSKQFAAMAVMMLAEDGALSVDDPIGRYVPELAGYKDIKIRHLLLHTSGLPDYYDEIDTAGGMPTNHDAAVLLGKMARVAFPAGERYEYSNPGYDMLAPIVAGASGMPFGEFVETRIFAPLGMSGSRVYDERKPLIPNRAYAYARSSDGFVPEDYDPLNIIVGSGGIYASLADLALWDAALYTDKLVSYEMLAEAFTSGTNNRGEALDYGYGWAIDSYSAHKRVRHGGSWVGFRTHIMRIPALRFTVILLSNVSDTDASALVDDITAIYLGPDTAGAAKPQ
jgi:CubicO group peptidase (beta-lactamase class C family)